MEKTGKIMGKMHSSLSPCTLVFAIRLASFIYNTIRGIKLLKATRVYAVLLGGLQLLYLRGTWSRITCLLEAKIN